MRDKQYKYITGTNAHSKRLRGLSFVSNILHFITLRYEHRYIWHEGRCGHESVNIWGWKSIYGVGDLTRIEGRFSLQNIYIDIGGTVSTPPSKTEISLSQESRPSSKTTTPCTRPGDAPAFLKETTPTCSSCLTKDINAIENLRANIVNC